MCQPDLWKFAGREPSLGEMMNDPLVHLVMARDNLSAHAVGQEMAQAKATLQNARFYTQPLRKVA
jgi:hypothetical protein